MSLGARLSIAVVLLLAGAGFCYEGFLFKDMGACHLLFVFAIICFISVASCFKGRHSALTNRIIGAFVFILYIAYIISEIYERKWFSGSRAEPSVYNAILGLSYWGLPAGYVMVYGQLPFNPFVKYEEDDTEPLNEDDDYENISED